jgi:hypothetical protein
MSEERIGDKVLRKVYEKTVNNVISNPIPPFPRVNFYFLSLHSFFIGTLNNINLLIDFCN